MLERHVQRVGKLEGVNQFFMAYDPVKGRIVFAPPIAHVSQDSGARMQKMAVEVLLNEVWLRNNVVIEKK
ncbi:MAG: hypothetical protein AUI17_05355 [Acidobacteriales bacterium 13_2_20CM_2_55_5]|nr:MAG: hypothetical protein AUI17_05355 [Acidobacteriales bacterium 13_2_20CM_2_55_5]